MQPGDEIQINDTYWFREDYLIQHSRLYRDIIETFGEPPHYLELPNSFSDFEPNFALMTEYIDNHYDVEYINGTEELENMLMIAIRLDMPQILAYILFDFESVMCDRRDLEDDCTKTFLKYLEKIDVYEACISIFEPFYFLQQIYLFYPSIAQRYLTMTKKYQMEKFIGPRNHVMLEGHAAGMFYWILPRNNRLFLPAPVDEDCLEYIQDEDFKNSDMPFVMYHNTKHQMFHQLAVESCHHGHLIMKGGFDYGRGFIKVHTKTTKESLMKWIKKGRIFIEGYKSNLPRWIYVRHHHIKNNIIDLTDDDGEECTCGHCMGSDQEHSDEDVIESDDENIEMN